MVDFVKYIKKCCKTKCRWISMTVNPYPPKQGDIVKIRIRVGKSNDLEKTRCSRDSYNIFPLISFLILIQDYRHFR